MTWAVLRGKLSFVMLRVLVAVCLGGALLLFRWASQRFPSTVRYSATTPVQPRASLPDDAVSKERFELLRHRADELQRNLLSLRVVEWRVAFQSYAGYGTVALVYNSLKSSSGVSCELGRIMVVGGVVLYFTSLYFSVRLQERIHFLRDAQNLYLDALHRRLNVPKLEEEAADRPIHKRWYAFGAFQVIHLLAFLGLLSYITPKSAECHLVGTEAVVSIPLVVVMFLLILKWYRTHSGGFREPRPW